MDAAVDRLYNDSHSLLFMTPEYVKDPVAQLSPREYGQRMGCHPYGYVTVCEIPLG